MAIESVMGGDTLDAMNKAASQLGKLAKGKKKTYSKEELARRASRLAEARKKRWPKKPH
jgi:hypothetical protein